MSIIKLTTSLQMFQSSNFPISFRSTCSKQFKEFFTDLLPFTNLIMIANIAENVMYVLSWRQTGKWVQESKSILSCTWKFRFVLTAGQIFDMLQNLVLIWEVFKDFQGKLIFIVAKVGDYVFVELRPLTCPLSSPQVIHKWIWSNGGMIWKDKNRRTRRKTCPSPTLSTTNPTWTALSTNPGLRGKKPATNRVTAFGAHASHTCLRNSSSLNGLPCLAVHSLLSGIAANTF
jgi:hypothetical protein